MSSWLVPLATAIAGGVVVAMYGQFSQSRSQIKRSRHEARTQLITTVIPALNTEGNSIFSSGSFRYVLASQLDQVNGCAFLCSKKEQAAAKALEVAWRKAIPPDMLVTSPVDISDEHRHEIQTRRSELQTIVAKRLRPIKARL